MNIDSMSLYERYSSIYAQYGMDRVNPVASIPDKNTEVKQEEVNQVSEASRAYEQLAEHKPNISIEDISLTNNKQEDFSFLGKDANIELLDMEKAISEVERDSILKKYQFFVGSSPELAENGAVIIK